MQISKRIAPQVLTAATGMLQPFIPELSPESLVAALKNHETLKQDKFLAEKPLTRQQAAALLSVSLPTLDRYLKTGLLKFIKLGPRAVRIDPASVRELLAGEINNG